MLNRVLSWVAAFIVGGVFGVAGTIAHTMTWGALPVGMIVGAIACAAILVAIRTLTHDRGAALATGLGMVGMLMLISGVGPGGSVVVENTALGQIWTYLVAGLVLLVIAWPSFRALPPRTVAPTQPQEDDELITSVPGVEAPHMRHSGETGARES